MQYGCHVRQRKILWSEVKTYFEVILVPMRTVKILRHKNFHAYDMHASIVLVLHNYVASYS